MPTSYQPKNYWGDLVSGNADLSHVGHDTLGSYNRYAYGLRLRAFKRALRNFDLKGKSVFEAAFGERFYLKRWQFTGVERVSGIDLSGRAHQEAVKEFPSYHLKHGDLSNPDNFKNFEKHDFTTAIDVLYHIVDDMLWQKAIRNLASVTKDDGTVLITEKFPLKDTYQNMPIVKRRSLAMWDFEFAKYGFKRKSITPVFVFMDDPFPEGEHAILGRLAALQWRALTKLMRMASVHRVLQDVICFLCASLQIIPELMLLHTLKRTPNLEIVLYTRVYS